MKGRCGVNTIGKLNDWAALTMWALIVVATVATVVGALLIGNLEAVALGVGTFLSAMVMTPLFFSKRLPRNRPSHLPSRRGFDDDA